jgi:hypothetical protein
MANRIQTASCFVHKSVAVDVRLLHEHHKQPKGFGGGEEGENKVWLCGSCHGVLHNLAHFINSGKQGLANDLAMQYQTMQNLSPAGRVRLLDLASTASQAMLDFDPDLDDESDEDTVIVQLRLTRKLHGRLKEQASNYINPKSGRQMGLYNYITRVLENHIRVATLTPRRRKNESEFFGNDGVIEMATAETAETDLSEEPTEPLRTQRRLTPIR